MTETTKSMSFLLRLCVSFFSFFLSFIFSFFFFSFRDFWKKLNSKEADTPSKISPPETIFFKDFGKVFLLFTASGLPSSLMLFLTASRFCRNLLEKKYLDAGGGCFQTLVCSWHSMGGEASLQIQAIPANFYTHLAQLLSAELEEVLPRVDLSWHFTHRCLLYSQYVSHLLQHFPDHQSLFSQVTFPM